MEGKSSEKAKPKKLPFNLYAPEAEKVFLAGDFNNWDIDTLPMKKNPEGMNTVSGSMEPGTMIPTLLTGLRILLEVKIVSEL